jgi:hypothetical protein
MASMKKLLRSKMTRLSLLVLWGIFSIAWVADRFYLKVGWSEGWVYSSIATVLALAFMNYGENPDLARMEADAAVWRQTGITGNHQVVGPVTAHEAEHPDRAAPPVRLDMDLGFPSWTTQFEGTVKKEDLVGPRPTIKKGRVVFETGPKKDLKLGGMDLSDITAMHTALIEALRTPDMRDVRANAVRQQLERPGIARNVFARVEELRMQDRAIQQAQMAQMSQAMGGVFVQTETDQQRQERNARIISELREGLRNEQLATPVWESTTETPHADG